MLGGQAFMVRGRQVARNLGLLIVAEPLSYQKKLAETNFAGKLVVGSPPIDEVEY